MHNFFGFSLMVILQMTMACSITKNQKTISPQYGETHADNHSDSPFHSLLRLKMEELVVYAQEKNPQFPFAAMIIETESGKEICRGINRSSFNPTLHGEIAAINNCVDSYGRDNLDWPKLTLITTAEPCPMCQGAIIWTGFAKIAYGTSIKKLINKGWRQIDISAEELSQREYK